MTQSQVRKRMLRPRVLAYSFILLLIMVGFVVSLATRTTLRMDVIRDRGVLGREVAGGMIENVYRLQFINTSESPVVLELSAKGLPQLSIVTADHGASTVNVEPASNRLVPVVVRVPASPARSEGHTSELQSLMRISYAVFCL